ncbi:MAG TPA: VanZ family protein [Methylomirabilota bacterium]|jgi:VanZ family protein|nr:VanZ family protein [Methylomirabilota bacterium]
MPSESRPRAARDPARFVPPLLWMALIAAGSSSLLSGDRTGRWMLSQLGHLAPWASPALLAGAHVGLRKLGHLVEFGILAVLWHRSLLPSPRAATAAFGLAAAYGGLDELWQGFHPSRTPAAGDVIVDAGGALLGLLAWTGAGPGRAAARRVAAGAVGLLAGLAALALAIDLALGRPAADLGVAATGLALGAAGLARLAWGPRSRVSSGPPAPGS